jgi:acylphosphatase
MKTYHYIIKGLVQGVFFRLNTKDAALDCDINGTVKNLNNGDVEVYAQGSEENIALFEGFLNSGPSLARVDKVIKEELALDETFSGFDVKL